MLNKFRLRPIAFTLILAASAGIAATASAQEGTPREGQQLRGSFNRPLGSGKGVVNENRVEYVASESNGDDTFTVTISGGSMKVEHNGKKVPSDRVVREGDHVKVMDKSGNVVHEFTMPNVPGVQAGEPPAAPEAPRAPKAPASPFGLSAATPPPVMVGILMEFDSDEEGLVVQKVIEGLPAEKAGLEAGDVIVKIDGKKVENNMSLREVLATKKAGDKVELSVKRDDEEKKITIDLAKYDQASLDRAQATASKGGFMGMSNDNGRLRAMVLPQLGAMGENGSETLHQQLERALEMLKSHQPDAEKAQADASKAIEEAMATLQKHLGDMRTHGTMMFKEIPGGVFEVPSSQGQAASNEKLDKLTSAIEKLTDRLERLEKRLEEQKK